MSGPTSGGDADTAGGTVLVVEDEDRLRELYVEWLAPLYDVTAVGTGADALTAVGSGTDVVLLDRNLPDLNGWQVLGKLENGAFDGKVAVVTGREPTTGIASVPLDDYLVKPVSRRALLTGVDSLLARRSYAELVDRYFELTAKLGVLEQTRDADALAEDAAYRQLVDDHESVAARLEARRETLAADGEYDKLFADLAPGA